MVYVKWFEILRGKDGLAGKSPKDFHINRR